MTFDEYCISKKIDPILFKKENESLYNNLLYVFNQVSPISFTQQKLFLINDLRRSYLYKEASQTVEKPVEKKPAPPKIPGIRPKTGSLSKPKIPGSTKKD